MKMNTQNPYNTKIIEILCNINIYSFILFRQRQLKGGPSINSKICFKRQDKKKDKNMNNQAGIYQFY